MELMTKQTSTPTPAIGELTAYDRQVADGMLALRASYLEGHLHLKQLQDYAALLRSNPSKHTDIEANIRLVHRISELGLLDFAARMMYVLNRLAGLQRPWMLVPPNRFDGQQMLDHINTATGSLHS